MATAFSQAALAEAKRAMDKAQAKFDETTKSLDEIHEKRPIIIGRIRNAQNELAEMDREIAKISSVNGEHFRAFVFARDDYEKMLALSRQQG